MILRRAPNLQVVEQDDGLVVYEQARGRVHFLNPSAALVFELCDGRRTTEEIAALWASLAELPAAPVDEVALALQRALAEGLLEPAE